MIELLLVASLIAVPAPAARPYQECVELHASDRSKIGECAAPSIDLDANPLLQQALAACSAAIAAARTEGAELRAATIIVAGIETTCTGP